MVEERIKSEPEVLLEQLDALMSEPVVDEEDALEVAIVAGSLARLGGDPAALAEAEAWRQGAGKELLASLWEAIDEEPLVEALEAASEGGASDAEVEEAVYDVDDLLVAAIWCGRRERVRSLARRAEAIVRSLPDVFEDLAPDGRALMRRREVAEELDLYGLWLVIAEAGAEG